MIKAYCCLNSNARDFSKVGKLYKNMGMINDKQVIDSSNVIKSISPSLENNRIYGNGFWLGEYENHKFLNH